MADGGSDRQRARAVSPARTFLRGLFSDPRRTGAISPSGIALARTMAAQIDPSTAAPVIELGPGTGVITDALVARGVSPDRLILVEFNSRFCALLARRYPEARIIEGDAGTMLARLTTENIGAPAGVVSGLPLLNFPLPQRVEIISAGLALGAPGMPFIQFTYGMGPPVAAGSGDYEVRKLRRVWRNLPPATVWLYRRPGHAGTSASF